MTDFVTSTATRWNVRPAAGPAADGGRGAKRATWRRTHPFALGYADSQTGRRVPRLPPRPVRIASPTGPESEPVGARA